MTTATWDRIVGKWHQVKGEVRTRWGKLTDDDLEQIAGEREKLVGKLQERYGISKDEINDQIDEWADNLQV
ncbi:MAG: CsbD family protein [Anaerolineae bacterium]